MLHDAKKRTPDDNPFQPGFGAVPEIWVGREPLLNLYERERRERINGRYTRGTVLIGPSGVGKSALVNRLAEESKRRGDVVLDALRVAKRTDVIAQIANTVTKARQTLATDTGIAAVERLLGRLHLVSVKGVQFSASKSETTNPHLIVRDSLLKFGNILQ